MIFQQRSKCFVLVFKQFVTLLSQLAPSHPSSHALNPFKFLTNLQFYSQNGFTFTRLCALVAPCRAQIRFKQWICLPYLYVYIVPEFRIDYFIVGITNDSPLVTAPVRGGYPLCGQYPDPAPRGAWMTVNCMDAAPSGRFVIVQQPADGIGYLTICEFEVYPRCAWPGVWSSHRNRTSIHFILSALA